MKIFFTLDDVIAVVEACKSAHEKRSSDLDKRIIESWTEANNNLAPIADRLGRLHAPVDGYTDCDNGTVYAKGQFLPTPGEYDSLIGEFFTKGSTTSECKWLVEASSQESVKSYMKNWCEIGFGSVWDLSGTDVCYAYMKTQFPAMATAFRNAEQRIKEDRESSVLDYNAKTKSKIEEGRYEVSGKVLRTKTDAIETTWAYAVVTKMTVEIEGGSVVFGTMPKKFVDDGVKAGDTVKFIATFKRSEKDPTFGCFTRPSPR